MSRTGGQSDLRKTADGLAVEHQVSPAAVKRAARFTRAVDEIAAREGRTAPDVLVDHMSMSARLHRQHRRQRFARMAGSG
jgi:hypothetical protein